MCRTESFQGRCGPFIFHTWCPQRSDCYLLPSQDPTSDPWAESAHREGLFGLQGIGNFAEMSTKGQIVSLPAPHSPYHSL